MSRKNIAWITFNAFIDTDLYIVRELASLYNIHWFVLKSGNDRFEYRDEILAIGNNSEIDIEMLECGARLRSLECVSFYKNLFRKIADLHPDIIYTSLAGAPYFIPMLAGSRIKNKVILAIHNVHVPKGGTSYWFFKCYNALALRAFSHYQTFSEDQYKHLKKAVSGRDSYWAPFILKDYGKATRAREDSRITFLNFGNIRPYKRIDVLIEAAQRAYTKTGIPFRVIIAGQCENWKEYETMITQEELFSLDIRRIANEEIPNLFAEADYFVAPYQDIAQSGSSIVAVNYGVPLIASKLPAFEEYIRDGETGILIEPANVASLESKIEAILLSHNAAHPAMVKRLIEMRETLFSTEAVVKRYKEFIDGVIERNGQTNIGR